MQCEPHCRHQHHHQQHYKHDIHRLRINQQSLCCWYWEYQSAIVTIVLKSKGSNEIDWCYDLKWYCYNHSQRMITDQSLSWRWSAFSGWSSLWGRKCWQLLWLSDWASDLDFSPQSSQKSIFSTPKKNFTARTKSICCTHKKSICSTHQKVFAAHTKKY